MKARKVVVTGGAGFIGSNLVRYLSNDNRVVVIDDLSTGHIKNIKDLIDDKKIDFIEGSVTDLPLLQKNFKNVHYVFHEAAIPSVPRSIKDPITTSNVSISGTLNVLIAARDVGIGKVIYASSSSVYGDTPTLPKTEEMTPNPLSPYAVAKLAGEYYCHVFNEVFHLPTAILRYFNVYGPRQDPASEYAAVIPNFITRILNDAPPLVYGDGNQTRDFTFVGDVINANILAAESDATGIFNAAGGKRISLNELAKTIMILCNKNLEIRYEAVRLGDIKHSLADISKAKEKFDYSPKFDIKNGLKETIQWFQKQS